MSAAIRSGSVAVLTAALAVLAAPLPAHADPHVDPSCATLTVTIRTVADVPSGLSVRALQEGRLYPPRCR
jgi:hypothetical protein